MSTQQAAYLGGGALAAVIVLAVLQAPPVVWLLAAVAALAIGTYVVSGIARSQGIDLAHEILSRMPANRAAEPADATTADAGTRAADPSTAMGRPSGGTDAAGSAATAATATPSDAAVEVSLVRAADDAAGVVAVWLHRCGGRRVHRYATDGGWVVEQVSTKDPDNPKKRIIGRSISVKAEDEAVRAADNLAQGILPEDVDSAAALGVPPAAAAEARRRRVKLTGQEQARRLAIEWGMLAGA
jgi:hypothetical protein